MNGQDFVQAIDVAVKDSAVRSVLSNIQTLTGARPEAALIEASNWFKELSPKQQTIVTGLLVRAAHYAVLNFLAVLDNSVPLEPGADRGEFELFYVRQGRRVRINDPEHGLEELLPPISKEY